MYICTSTEWGELIEKEIRDDRIQRIRESSLKNIKEFLIILHCSKPFSRIPTLVRNCMQTYLISLKDMFPVRFLKYQLTLKILSTGTAPIPTWIFEEFTPSNKSKQSNYHHMHGRIKTHTFCFVWCWSPCRCTYLLLLSIKRVSGETSTTYL